MRTFHTISRPPRNENKIRLSLDLSPRVRARMDQLKAMTDAESVTEVIRRALTVYDVLLTAQIEKKTKIIVREADGSETMLLIP